jgi:hypothetical protein
LLGRGAGGMPSAYVQTARILRRHMRPRERSQAH